VEDGLSPINDTRFPRAQDPFVAALADQLVRRWQIALAQLHTHDAELALQVRSALGLLAEVEPRVSVPAWNPLPASTQRLLTDLLDMRLSPQRRADLATQWLREQPTFTAWVRDDGGVLVEKHAEESSEPRSPLATIALTNLSAREELAWIAPRDSAAAPDPRPLEPRRTLAVATPVLPLDVAGQQLAQRGVAAMLAPDTRRDIVATLGDDAGTGPLKSKVHDALHAKRVSDQTACSGRSRQRGTRPVIHNPEDSYLSGGGSRCRSLTKRVIASYAVVCGPTL
jgi:hypothetical protein